MTKVPWEPPSLKIVFTSPGGSDIALDLRREGDVLAGSLRWAEYEGNVELIRSPLPVRDVDPASYADAAGFYERSRGDVIELAPRHWGEMLYRERRTGRLRTLLPLEEDLFFLGSAVYVPEPVEARIRKRGFGASGGERVVPLEQFPEATPRIGNPRPDPSPIIAIPSTCLYR